MSADEATSAHKPSRERQLAAERQKRFRRRCRESKTPYTVEIADQVLGYFVELGLLSERSILDADSVAAAIETIVAQHTSLLAQVRRRPLVLLRPGDQPPNGARRHAVTVVTVGAQLTLSIQEGASWMNLAGSD